MLDRNIANYCSSNGIRFSISDLSPPTARVMPTVYMDRSDISLYDAQYSEGGKVPIPQSVIHDVLSALLRFKRTCEDFGLKSDRIRVVATEATREAINSEDFRQQIQSRTGWPVELLPKEEEGRLGAMGIASSFSSVKGLALDLGGGSVQISWLYSESGQVETSPKGSVSFPYGAAALTKLMEGAPGAREQQKLQNQLSKNFEQAIEYLKMPATLIKEAMKEEGFTLYLSGGGFRGWGYILMSLHATQPYPIPMINGFRVPRSAFLPDLQSPPDSSMFRISSRRASQVPAVKFLITALTQSLPFISNIYFAQGGVREGLLFSTLPPQIRSQDPLIIATLEYSPGSTQDLAALLCASIPPFVSKSTTANFFTSNFLTSIIHLLTAHAHLTKDIRAATSLRATTTGLLASTHGISHSDRAVLALVLCERWGAELSLADTQFHSLLQSLVGQEVSWWAKYLGRVARGLGDLFPTGLMREEERKGSIAIEAEWLSLPPSSHHNKKENNQKSSNIATTDNSKVILINIVQLREGIDTALRNWAEQLEKVGKKKNWVGGAEGFGFKVQVQVKQKILHANDPGAGGGERAGEVEERRTSDDIRMDQGD